MSYICSTALICFIKHSSFIAFITFSVQRVVHSQFDLLQLFLGIFAALCLLLFKFYDNLHSRRCRWSWLQAAGRLPGWLSVSLVLWLPGRLLRPLSHRGNTGRAASATPAPHADSRELLLGASYRQEAIIAHSHWPRRSSEHQQQQLGPAWAHPVASPFKWLPHHAPLAPTGRTAAAAALAPPVELEFSWSSPFAVAY